MSDNIPVIHYLKPEILQKIGDLELIAREVVEGLRAGSHRSPLKGFSTEFAHHRQYVPGDPIRNIDYALVDTSRPLDGFLSEFSHEREATLGGGSAGPRQ